MLLILLLSSTAFTVAGDSPGFSVGVRVKRLRHDGTPTARSRIEYASDTDLTTVTFPWTRKPHRQFERSAP